MGLHRHMLVCADVLDMCCPLRSYLLDVVKIAAHECDMVLDWCPEHCQLAHCMRCLVVAD
eukprot:1930847-Amphidinium_carterae.2